MSISNDNARAHGQTLQAARTALGLSLTDASARLRVPVHVLEALEDGQWSQLGAPIYLRGYLRKYGELLHVPEPSLDLPAHGVAAPAPLQPRSYTPHSRWMLEQLGRRATYVALTVVFVAVPVWLLTKPYLGRMPQVTTSIDPPRVDQTAIPVRPAGVAAPRPTLASMTPIGASAKALELSFAEDSWLETRRPDGSVIESITVKAGERRAYSAGDLGRVVVGNAEAVTVVNAGSALNMAPYQRGNVLRFAVSSDGAPAPLAGN